ncbi:M48 family metalloprotease [Desulfolithobacter sp.]
MSGGTHNFLVSSGSGMIYNNLIYFLVVIFVFATDTAPKEPLLAPAYGAMVLGGLLVFFWKIAARLYRRARFGSASSYFAAEKRLSILAVLFFLVAVYVVDLKYYLRFLSLKGQLPVLENLGGLAIFFVFLTLMWLQARPAYEAVFQRHYTPARFVISNIKANLPIVLPWLVLSLVFDLLSALPLPRFQQILTSPWGDLILFLAFVVFLAVFFPPLVRWLWNCRPMPDSPLRREIERFCRQQDFKAEILYWPLFEGQVLTAGIMGIVPRLRYLLITPALLAALDPEELESVLAHEIGHVKRLHLVLYIYLFLGFSLLAGALARVLPYLVLGWDFFYLAVERLHVSPDTLLALFSGGLILLLMIVYFRFIFGFFIRNFERQADLYVFRAQGTSWPLIRSFEKIATLSGNIRDEKSWHHFGIGERIDFLQRCEQDRSLIQRHDRKVWLGLAAYTLIVFSCVVAVRQVDVDKLAAGNETRYMEAVLEQKLRQEPKNSVWLLLLGDLMQEKKMERKAINAYERALELDPLNGDVANNLAWLLLTASDPTLRDPVRALTLARTAVTLKQQGYILDTLATAYWANNLKEEAILTELKALELDPENRRYYLDQIRKFKETTWDRQGS